MTEPRDPAIGKDVDGYRILDVLGQGGMGIVYKAEDVALSRTVALKMIDPALARDAAFLRRFRSEARALARIDSSYIVRIYALRETDLGVFIVMEYVEGGTLEDRILERHIAWQDAVPIIRQMLQALDHAHSVGVIHRDVKPANIMLTQAGGVKVADFGLAKLHQTDANVTVTKGISGTLYYMSPEQVKGLGDVDHRSDLYSAGMTIYKLLAGSLPFDRSEGEFTIMRRIVEEPVPRLDAQKSDLPVEIVDLVDRALVKDPDKRFQSAAEMLEALDALALAEPATTHRRAVSSVAEKGRSRISAALAVAAVVLVVIAGGVGFVWLNGPEWLRASEPVEETAAFIIETITTEPSGATVYLDGVAMGETPLHDIEHNSGRAPMRIEKDGYETVDTTVALTAGIPLQFDLALVEEAPATGGIRVTSLPEDARVWINDEAVGRTPFEGKDYVPGPVSVRVEKEGFETWSEQVDVEAGEEQHITARLQETARAEPEPADPEPQPPAATGRLTLTVEPEGTVSVGDEQRESSGTFSVPVGRHRAVFTHLEHSIDTTITIDAGQEVSITAYFGDSLHVNTSGQWGGSVFVNGEFKFVMGDGRNKLPLPPGTHYIELQTERTDLYIDGGTYRVWTDQGSLSAEQEFSGSAYPIEVEPAFSPREHRLVFEVLRRVP